MPCSRIVCDRVEDEVDQHRRQTHRRLVEQQQLRAGPSAPGRRRASAARRRTSCRPSARCAPAAAGTARAPAPGRRRCSALSLRRNAPRSRFSVDGHPREDAPALGRLADARARRSRARATPVMPRPSKMTSPLRGRSSPEMVRSVVDLPAPFEPIRVTISPGSDRRGSDALDGGDVAVVDVQVVDARACGVGAGRGGRRADAAVIRRSRRPRCRSCRGRPRRRAGRCWISSGPPSAIFSPRSSTVIRSDDPHDHAHVVLDEQDRELLLVAHPVDEVDERAPTPAGSCPPSARRAAAPSAAAPARGRPRAGAGRRRRGCARTRRRDLADADELEQLARELAAPRAPRGAAAAAAAPCRGCPTRMCECIATMTFSSAVIRSNSRMFWNVRASPSAAILCGGRPVTSRVAEAHPPDGRLVQAGEHVEERGLAGAVGADQADDRAVRGS